MFFSMLAECLLFSFISWCLFMPFSGEYANSNSIYYFSLILCICFIWYMLLAYSITYGDYLADES